MTKLSDAMAHERPTENADLRALRESFDASYREEPTSEAQFDREFLVCEVEGMLCAIALDRIAAVLPPLHPVPVPLAPPSLAGVINFRGQVIPVVSAASHLGLPMANDTTTPCVVVQVHEHRVGLTVSDARRLERVRADAISPTRNAGKNPSTDACSECFDSDGQPVFVVDLDALFASLVAPSCQLDFSTFSADEESAR